MSPALTSSRVGDIASTMQRVACEIMVTEKVFFRTATEDQIDVVELVLSLLDETETDYCVIGGLAVNAYVEPTGSSFQRGCRMMVFAGIKRTGPNKPDFSSGVFCHD